jgi:pyruvate dehydrogenase E2 component (dihydrolipoamide acetyltransferase)
MPTPVVMPQMGESVAEGTIVRWMKKVGDSVERDEPLFEISTDKIDAEIPSPAAGVLSEIRVKEGETVPIDSVVAVIGEGSGAAAPAPAAKRAAAPAPVAPASAGTATADKPADKSAPPASAPQGGASASAGTATADEPADESAPPVASVSAPQGSASASAGTAVAGKAARQPSSPDTSLLTRPWSAAEARALRLSPVVRNIAREHRIDVRNIAGSGAGGRVTKADILSYLDAGAPVGAPSSAPSSQTASAGKPALQSAARPEPVEGRAPAQLEGVERVPMTIMRRKIAEHMVMSRRTSAHVHSVFEIDFTNVDGIRKARKQDYEKAGAKLTYMSFITKAAAEALKGVRVVNASVDGNDILYRKDINIGVAVALDWGLIVPVIRNADKKNLLEISKAIVDVATRARDKKLSPDDVQGGTFTITNPGVFGAQFGMPIINQPQVAILGVGAVEKRAVVVDDAVTIRLRAYLTLGYDHRIIDGAVADQFMSHIKKRLENYPAAED